jgi:hypothetical protein
LNVISRLAPGSWLYLRGLPHHHCSFGMVVESSAGDRLILSCAHSLGSLVPGGPTGTEVCTASIVGMTRPADEQVIGEVIRSEPLIDVVADGESVDDPVQWDAVLIQPRERVALSNRTGAGLMNTESWDVLFDLNAIGIPVAMDGASSGLRSGRVIETYATHDVSVRCLQRGVIDLTYDTQIWVEGDESAFARSGDSGSIVFDSQNRPLAMAIAVERAGDTSVDNRALCAPITGLLRLFDVQLVDIDE